MDSSCPPSPMRNGGAAAAAAVSATTTAGGGGGGGGGDEEIILEDYLLKKGTSYYHRAWHNRYFVFTADNTLRYYKNKSDVQPKLSLPLGQLQDCEISELYVTKRQHGSSSASSSGVIGKDIHKESSGGGGGAEKAVTSSSSSVSVATSKNSNLLYCIKITWTANDNDLMMDDSLDNDTDTISSQHQPQQQQHEADHDGVVVDHVPKDQDHQHGIHLRRRRRGSGLTLRDHNHNNHSNNNTSNRSLSSQSASTTKATTLKKKLALKRLFRHKRTRSEDTKAHMKNDNMADHGHHDGDDDDANHNNDFVLHEHDPNNNNHNHHHHHGGSGRTNPLLLLSPLIHKRTVSFPPASASSSGHQHSTAPPLYSSFRRKQVDLLDGSGMGTVAEEAAAVARARSAAAAAIAASSQKQQQQRGAHPLSTPQSSKKSLLNVDDDYDDMEIPNIPTMVTTHSQQQQHEHEHGTHEDDSTLPMANVNNTTLAATATKNKPLVYKDELDEEKSYLRQMYLTDKKLHQQRNKRKLVEAAKVAAAAGAAVGVAVMTAGMGIVAGLLFLGVGAAAGGAGGAMAMSSVAWRNKNKHEGEIIMAATDYETMKKWKACLDAGLLSSGTIKKSKWGQLFVGEGDNKRRLTIFPRGGPGSSGAGGTGGSIHHGPSSSDGHVAGGEHGKKNHECALHFEKTCKWRPLEGGWAAILGTGTQGLRIFREEHVAKKASEDVPEMGNSSSNNSRIRWATNILSIDGRPYAPLKSHVVVNAAPLDAFLCLMSFGLLKDADLTPNCGQRASFRIIETIDDNTDIIHLICNPLYLFPCWTFPRDFVLYRYWRVEHDGCFVVCYESVTHNDCPPHPDFVRGDMHQVITFAPDKKLNRRKAGSKEQQAQRECLMTAVVQVDPKGWIPSTPLTLLANQAYGEAFAVAALMQLLDIRDAIDVDRFVSVALDEHVQHLAVRARSFDDTQPNIAPCNSMDSDGLFLDDPTHYDFAFCSRESVLLKDSRTGLSSHPPPLQREQWAEPDANSFRVRGAHYKMDRQKINAGRPIGRLVAVDICNVGDDGPMYHGFTMHPTERFQLALQREKSLKEKGLVSDMPPYCFVVNIILPGPPFFHIVCYYAVDNMSTINGSDGSPSSRLANEFFFGDNDAFRDKTFKLIPQIVQGNFIVRKAVGSTPAIMGKKLRQLYVKTPRSFEVILDCGSSSVATGVIRLSIGYAKTLVVDMGFLLEGDDESRLPERIFGCVRIKNLDFSTHIRKVAIPKSTPCLATSTYTLPPPPPPPSSSPGGGGSVGE